MRKKEKFRILCCFNHASSHSCYNVNVAKVWKSSFDANIELEDIQKHGWEETSEILWVEKPFPDDVEAILVNEGFDDIVVSEITQNDLILNSTPENRL